jgi:hypothetical protein
VQQLRHACAAVSEGRRHEAALYRWMSSRPETQRERDPSSSDLDAHGDRSNTSTSTSNQREDWQQLVHLVAGDPADLAMLRELEAAVEALVLTEGSNGLCSDSATAAVVHRVVGEAEAEICRALRDSGAVTDAMSPTHAQLHSPQTQANPHLHPRTNPPIPTHTHINTHLQYLQDHPLTRLYRDRLPPPLPQAHQPLHSLHTTHRDLLQRTAQACAPYAPYTCHFV